MLATLSTPFVKKSCQPWGVTLLETPERKWFQEKLTVLLGKERLSYAEIARRSGVTKQYLHKVTVAGSPSKKLIDGMCKAFGFDPPGPPGARAVVDPVTNPTMIVNEPPSPYGQPTIADLYAEAVASRKRAETVDVLAQFALTQANELKVENATLRERVRQLEKELADAKAAR